MIGTVDELRSAAATVMLTSFPGDTVPAWLLDRVEAGAGGVCLYGSNRNADFGAVSERLRDVRQSVVTACDEEGGDVTRLEALTGSSVPGNAALGAVDDPALTRAVAAALGAALREAGIDLDLAPCADVNSDPANPVVGVRSFGAEAELVARHTVAYVAGLHDAGVAACAKHFPGHGAVDVDSHRDLPRLDASRAVLDGRELVPFRAAIAAGVDAVMPGHLLVPALDSRPATVSAAIVTGLLRGLGFEGVVVTDALDMGGIGGPALIPANVVGALVAGADLCCLGPDNDAELYDACVDAVVEAVAAGRLAEARLLEAAGRVGGLRRPSDGGRTPAGHRRLHEVGIAAATSALRIEGPLPSSITGAHVIELDRPENPAAGIVRWGVGGPLSELERSVTVTRVRPADARRVGDLVQAAAGSPLVLVVRDARRIPDLAEAAGVVLGLRPDTVVVDMGWPADGAGGVVPSSATRIVTHGASRASGDAVAALLAGVPGAQPLVERITNG